MKTEQNKRPVIDASFNIFDSGWKKFGNHRKYIAGNVDRIINGDIAQERVDRRVMLGFFGHRSNPPLEPLENIRNMASNVTARLKFYPSSGDVEHTQEILPTDTGKAVLGLHGSNIGNFSWRGRAKGGIMADNNQFSDDAGRHLRFDYVYVPGMVNQPKKDAFISEGVGDSPELKKILERCLDAGLAKDEALEMLDDWQRRGILLEESTQSHDILTMALHIKELELAELTTRRKKHARLVEEAIGDSVYLFDEKAKRLLTGELDATNKEDVLEAVENLLQYSGAQADGRFPTAANQKTVYLSQELFKGPGAKPAFNPANTLAGPLLGNNKY